MRQRWASIEGAPLPLGVSWIPDERAFNFALYAKHAERVILVAYSETDVAHPILQRELDHLHHKSGRVWHCRIGEQDLLGARFYAYRVSGPFPEGRLAWHAFDPAKVLLDPYAPAVFFPPDFDQPAAARPGDNAGRAPLGVLPRAKGNDHPPRRRDALLPHESDTIIYELHVRNFTRHESSGVPPEHRGTFAGIIDKIPYLVELGITAVELMPVFQYDPSGRDRWGYMPLSFFALHHEYLSAPDPDDTHAEFRALTDALHAAGIEVLLDVVFNHTCERGSAGPTYSYKGIDNSTYYLMTGDPNEPYADFSGTGNTLNCANHAVRKMILDSMRHWLRLGVDGFRFDLASIFARGADGTIRYDESPIFGEISADPEFAGVRLIAEPWDAGADQLGRPFPGLAWQQWNGAFRDDVRRFVRGDPGMVGAVMRRLYGSDDLFPDDRLNAYHPFQSVNYVTSHDGPTLYDLVTYETKHNWANGHGNSDGPPRSFAWNCGWEGDEGVPENVKQLRVRQTKNLLAMLLLANGTPMLRAGDELLFTQGGNDNPYNQDNEATWIDWRPDAAKAEVGRFARRMIAFRKAHPSLGRVRFWRDDVQWFGVDGEVDLSTESRALGFLLRGGSQHDHDLCVFLNASEDQLTFRGSIPSSLNGWTRTIDTAEATPPCDAPAAIAVSSHVDVAARSVVVLVGPRNT